MAAAAGACTCGRGGRSAVARPSGPRLAIDLAKACLLVGSASAVAQQPRRLQDAAAADGKASAAHASILDGNCVLCWLLIVAVLAGAGSALVHLCRHRSAAQAAKRDSSDEATTPLSASADKDPFEEEPVRVSLWLCSRASSCCWILLELALLSQDQHA